MEAPQKILDKIKKLKALSEGAAQINSIPQRGDSLPYGEKQFEDEMTEFAIDHNSVIELFTY